MPFADGSFDIVISNASLHHWANPPSVFNEIKRVTRQGGFCLIRDNMRLSPLYGPLFNVICFWKRMSEEQRDLWVRAIRASYTTNEVRAMLNASGLEGWNVSINAAFLDLDIKWSPEG
jgi:SAM-dependent methyltransferase